MELECPECKQQSLKFDPIYKLYHCTNEACKVTFSEKDLARKQHTTSVTTIGDAAEEKQASKAIIRNEFFDPKTNSWKYLDLKTRYLSDNDPISINAFFGAVAGGLAGAILGGAIWYYSITLTGWMLGIVAIGIGYLVGYGVIYGSGQKRAKKLQILSCILTFIALLFGQYLIMQYYFYEEGFIGLLPLDVFFRLYLEYLKSSFWSLIEIAIFAFAMWRAYTIPSPY